MIFEVLTMDCDSKSQFFRSRHTQSVYPIMTYWVLKVYRVDYPSCCILSHEMSQILVLYLKLSLLQAKKVSENQKKLLFKKNRLSTAASIFLIIQLFKWFSSALASSSPHLGYFQKSNLSSKDKITLEKSQYLFDSIYFVMIANFLNESHYSLPLCRWEYYPMLRISVIKELKVHPWNFHLKMVDSVSPVWACCWIEVTVTQIDSKHFSPTELKRAVQETLYFIG